MSLELGTFLFCYQSVANSSTESLKVESHDNFCIMNLIEKILPGLHPTAKTEAGQMMKKSFEWFIEMPHDNYSLFPDTRYGF
jgi:hypothetical protein